MAGDRRLLESLVANLVENAVGHNRPGGRVSVTTSSRDGRSVVEVVNDGDVLDPAVAAERCSSPSSASTAAPAATAPASGLSIVRSVAQAHGGAVALAVCPDGGLRATVTLPRREAAEPTHPDRYSRERAHA